MKLIDNILSCDLDFKKGSYIAIGNFDGVHMGHQTLIKDMVENAKKNNCASIVFTFLNHPAKSKYSTKNTSDFGYINNNEEKLCLLESLRVDFCIMQPFNENICNLSPYEFIRLLKDKLNIKEVYVGFNFSFGKGAIGTTRELKLMGEELDIKINEYGPIILDGDVISSTLIRKNILGGNFKKVVKMLGHPLLVIGDVVHGKKIARLLGFPTANINVKDRLYPPFGIYGAVLQIDRPDAEVLFGVVNVGINPTLKPGELCLEVHILDFEGDLYGHKIYLQMIEFMREEKKFDSIDELKSAIQNNVDTWRAFKEKLNNNGDSFKIRKF